MAKANDIKALTTRLQNCAAAEGVSVEQLLLRPYHELLRVANLGPKTIAVGRGMELTSKKPRGRGFADGFAKGRIAAREQVAQWMIARSYATGHGDTIEDLLANLEWQAKEAGRD